MMPRWLVVVGGFVCALWPALNTLATAVDPDTWWHLAVGRDIATTGHIPHVDPYSRMSRAEPTTWRAYSWLFEWAMYQAYLAGGLTGVMWFRSLLAGAAVAGVSAFAARRAPGTMLGFIAVAASPMAMMAICTERPWHVSILFTTAALWAVTAVREGCSLRQVWWLPLLFAVWANVHIQFVMGWGVLGLACLFPGQGPRFGFVGLLLVCVLATLVNPYGPGLFTVIWEYSTHSTALQVVAEFASPRLDEWWTWVVIGLLAGAGVATGLRRPVSMFDVLLLLTGAVLTARTQRDIWFGVLVAVAVLKPEPAPNRFRKWAIPIAVFAAFLTVRTLNATGFAWRNDFEAAQATEYPVAAANHVRNAGHPGPLFNDFNWGGYFIWALPDHPVTIDGRTNLYGDARILTSEASWRTTDGWQHDPDFASANLVIASPSTALAGVLRGSPEWRITHEDAMAVVFVRR